MQVVSLLIKGECTNMNDLKKLNLEDLKEFGIPIMLAKYISEKIKLIEKNEKIDI
jgi:hypothetical protein